MRLEIHLLLIALLGFLAVQESLAVPSKNGLKKTSTSVKTKTKTKTVSSTLASTPSPKTKPKVDATCTVTSTLAGSHYSAVQVAQVAQGAGFTGNNWVVSVAVALAESGGWTQAVLVDSDCSRDRGLWQINSYWHSEVTDAMAFDPNQNAAAAYRISNSGSDWSQWTTYTGGAYLAQMSTAQAAVNSVSGGSSGGGGGGSTCANYGAPCPSSAHCCSQWGYCGSTSDYCGSGCNAAASYQGRCS